MLPSTHEANLETYWIIGMEHAVLGRQSYRRPGWHCVASLGERRHRTSFDQEAVDYACTLVGGTPLWCNHCPRQLPPLSQIRLTWLVDLQLNTYHLKRPLHLCSIATLHSSLAEAEWIMLRSYSHILAISSAAATIAVEARRLPRGGSGSARRL